MKVTLLVSILLMFTILTSGCSLSTKESRSNINANSIGAASPTDESKDKARLPPIPYEEMLEMVAKISKQGMVSNLREVNLSDSETEIRIWIAFGLAYPNCFILKIQKDSQAAFLVAPKAANGKVVFHKKGEPIYAREALGVPRSGWDEVLSYLKAQGIDSSVKLSLDKIFNPDPDVVFVVIEVKTGPQYSMVFYSDSTESQDGQKAFSICRRIEDEFGERIGCGR